MRLDASEPITLTVIDYTPSAGIKDGKMVTVNRDMKLNPAYLVSVVKADGEALRQWVVPSQPETEQLGDLRLHFVDFHNIEYTVLAFSRPSSEWLIYTGMLLVVLAALGMLAVQIRKPSEKYA